MLSSTADAQTVKIDKTFSAHGIPGVEINATGEIGYEFVFLYKLVEMGGKTGLCGAVITNWWNKDRRKVVGVTVASLGGVKLKRGLNYMPEYKGGERSFPEPELALIGRRYVWLLDPKIASGKSAKCKKMRPAWSDTYSRAKVDFSIPSVVYVNR